MPVHALISQCTLSVLSYSECKITKTFRAFAHGPQWGGLTASPSRLPVTQPKTSWIRHYLYNSDRDG